MADLGDKLISFLCLCLGILEHDLLFISASLRLLPAGDCGIQPCAAGSRARVFRRRGVICEDDDVDEAEDKDEDVLLL